MAESSPVRIGIVGAGGFANTHMEEFAKVDGAEVVAFCRRDGDALAEMQAVWGVSQGFTDYREMLERDDIDAIDVITPTPSHHQIVMDAIAAGKHVLCDKPLAMTAAESQEMLDAAEAAGIVHCTNFNQRGRTPVGQMKRLVDDGYIGNLYHMHITWWQSHAPDQRPDARTWRFFPEQGGGTIYELIHTFDIALWFGGPVKRLTAVAPTLEPHRTLPEFPDGVDVTAPDSSAFLLEFEAGSYAVIHTSFITRGLDYDDGTTVHLDVAGSNGRLVNENLTGIKGISGIGNRHELRDVDPGLPYPQPYEQFTKAILDGEPVKTSFVAGLEAAKLRDASEIAAKEGRWVEIN